VRPNHRTTVRPNHRNTLPPSPADRSARPRTTASAPSGRPRPLSTAAQPASDGRPQRSVRACTPGATPSDRATAAAGRPWRSVRSARRRDTVCRVPLHGHARLAAVPPCCLAAVHRARQTPRSSFSRRGPLNSCCSGGGGFGSSRSRRFRCRVLLTSSSRSRLRRCVFLVLATRPLEQLLFVGVRRRLGDSGAGACSPVVPGHGSDAVFLVLVTRPLEQLLFVGVRRRLGDSGAGSCSPVVPGHGADACVLGPRDAAP